MSKKHEIKTSKNPRQKPAPPHNTNTDREFIPQSTDMFSVERMHQLFGNSAIQRMISDGQLQSASSTHFRLNTDALDGKLGKAPTIQRLIKSPRFEGNEDVKKADEGKNYICQGDKGQEVVRIQQALIDARYKLPKFGVDGHFGWETKKAVIAFQKDQGFPKENRDGIVGPQTMTALSKYFEGYKVEAEVAKNQTSPTKPTDTEFALGSAPKELLEGTRKLSAADKAEAAKAITTEQTVNPKTGKPPKFDKDNPKPGYEASIRKTLNDIIDSQFDRFAKGKANERKDSKNLHDWSDFKGPAEEAKKATDKVFGNYAQRPALKPGVNLFDRWENIENRIKADPSRKKGIAEWRVRKILEASDGPIAVINKDHGAIISRPQEKAILDAIKADVVSKREAELVEIHKGWPGAAGGGNVFMQRYKAKDKDKDKEKELRRQTMWENFATIIHEYLHLLEHSNHVNYREGLSDTKGGKVLREGIPDYFKNIVWNDINLSDLGLQKAVEGPYHDPKNTTNPDDIKFGGKYGESNEAEQLAGIVGIRNLMAAFFLGRVDLIGGPTGKIP